MHKQTFRWIKLVTAVVVVMAVAVALELCILMHYLHVIKEKIPTAVPAKVRQSFPPLLEGIPTDQLHKMRQNTKPNSNYSQMSTLGGCIVPPGPANQTGDDHLKSLQQLGISETIHTVKPRPSDQAAITRAWAWLNHESSKRRRRRYKRFAPLITAQEKAQLLLTWRVLLETLTLHNVSHYVIGGTQIGAVRHRGLIPWDNDMDVAVHENDAERARRALSCVPGYTLRLTRGKAWKFFADDAPVVPRFGESKFLHPEDLANRDEEWNPGPDVVFRWPCVDLFLMTNDSSYAWCTSRLYFNTCVYSLKDVFPLTMLEFEGMQVPAPGRSVSIVKRIVTDKNLCRSISYDHKELRCRLVSTVPCEELAPMYTMYPLV